LGTLRESGAVSDPNRTSTISIINTSVAEQGRADASFDALKYTEQRIERTARRILVALIHGNR
jgi:hypothetical protein